MITEIQIETISSTDYNYSLTFASNNDFTLILNPSISFTKRLKLTIKF